MLGANVGTNTHRPGDRPFSVAAVAPLFILGGVIAFKPERAHTSRRDPRARAGIGLGIIMLALHLLVEVVRPVEHGRCHRARSLVALTGEAGAECADRRSS